MQSYGQKRASELQPSIVLPPPTLLYSLSVRSETVRNGSKTVRNGFSKGGSEFGERHRERLRTELFISFAPRIFNHYFSSTRFQPHLKCKTKIVGLRWLFSQEEKLRQNQRCLFTLYNYVGQRTHAKRKTTTCWLVTVLNRPESVQFPFLGLVWLSGEQKNCIVDVSLGHNCLVISCLVVNVKWNRFWVSLPKSWTRSAFRFGTRRN